MISVTLVKRAENPANDVEYRGWFLERDVKKNFTDWVKDYDEVILKKPKIGVLNAVAPWAEQEQDHGD